MASPPPGITLATMQPMNGSSQRMAAINNQQASINYQNNLINATGGRKQQYKGGFINPQNKAIYPDVGGPGQTTAGISNKLAVAQSQNYANGVFDTATQKGGRLRRKSTHRRVLSRRCRNCRCHQSRLQSRSRSRSCQCRCHRSCRCRRCQSRRNSRHA